VCLSNDEYADINSAQTSKIPPALPEVLEESALSVARFIIQSGSISASLVESAFSIDFGASVVSSHNNLVGIQGGQG
jgi:hypothetical protein